MPQLSITTDYHTCVGDPEPYLRNIADAGFTHLQWSHHFTDDFFYEQDETNAIRSMLSEYQLELLDVHGSFGQKKRWWSLDEAQRQAGVELVRNRIRFFSELEGQGHLIMHIPHLSDTFTEKENALQRAEFQQVIRSLDELVPELERDGVRLALENMPNDTWELLEQAVNRYPENVVGFCYDSGHGNIKHSQMAMLEKNKSRLYALHLNDNNGCDDLHQPPFTGTVNWDELANIIGTSAYSGPLNFEITTRSVMLQNIGNATLCGLNGYPPSDEFQRKFLRDAHARCRKVNELCYNSRNREKIIASEEVIFCRTHTLTR